MARGVYTVSAANQTVAGTIITLAFINPGVTQTIEILRAWVSQNANATSAQQRIQMSTQVSTFPTLVTATPAKTSLIDQASAIVGGTAGAAGTCGVNASAEGAGAKTIIMSDAFNVLNGWLWVATPADSIILNASAASGFGLVFPAAPTTLTGWNWGVEYREW